MNGIFGTWTIGPGPGDLPTGVWPKGPGPLGWTDRWIYMRTDRWTDKYLCILQDIAPLGPLPKKGALRHGQMGSS